MIHESRPGRERLFAFLGPAQENDVKSEKEILVRTEELLIATVGGNMPETSVILELLADISDRLQSFDPERN